MFAPRDRLSIYNLVRPPAPDWSIDALIVCTYSASLSTVLSLPAAIVADLPGAASPRFTATQLAALRRLCNRTVIFCQNGAIHPAYDLSPAIIETEDMIREVAAPRGGTFHPKLWVIGYCGPGGAKTLLRVAICSRNLTPDRSWDLTVIVEGEEGSATPAANDLSRFLHGLPDLPMRRPLGPERAAVVRRLADSVERTKWRLPKGLSRLDFHAIGIGGRNGWRPPENDRMAILSPFLESRAVARLSATSRASLFIVSRRDAIDRTWAGLDGFARKLVLSPPPDPANGEPGGELHAKAYVWEKGRRRGLAIGSVNATLPAIDGRNVEFLASFDCTAALGESGIETLLGADELGRVILDYAPNSDAEAPAELFDDRPAKRALSTLELRVLCREETEGWRLMLRTDVAIDAVILAQLPGLSYRPATLTDSDAAPCLPDLAATGTAAFPRPLDLSQITGFIVFRAGAGDRLVELTLNLPVSGVSDDARREAVIRAIIPDDRSFLDFVRGLLGDFSALEQAPGSGPAGDGGAGVGAWSSSGQGLLELLVRCAADDPARFRIIEQALADLEGAPGSNVVPKAFRQLWDRVIAARGAMR